MVGDVFARTLQARRRSPACGPAAAGRPQRSAPRPTCAARSRTTLAAARAPAAARERARRGLVPVCAAILLFIKISYNYFFLKYNVTSTRSHNALLILFLLQK